MFLEKKEFKKLIKQKTLISKENGWIVNYSSTKLKLPALSALLISLLLIQDFRYYRYYRLSQYTHKLYREHLSFVYSFHHIIAYSSI